MTDNTEERKYPVMNEQTRNLALSVLKQMKDTASTGQILASQEVKEQRLSTCYTCEYYDVDDRRCRACGCFISTKVTMSANSCPKHKWEK
jgi:hypothetical protein